ncbi:hypothetical protein KSS87_001144 [Heliosperma pusillum]|nr:hypothetical protein KSS87_001144 [Heliosperma pusillum]
MELNDDEWELNLTADQLDSLERDALRQISQRNSSSSSSSSIPPFPHSTNIHNTIRPQVDAPLGSRVLPSSVIPKVADDSSKEGPKQTLKFFLHATGNIAARFPYDQVLVNTIKKIPKATWNAKERLWIFPLSSLSSAEDIIKETRNPRIEVENLDPLVRRAIAAATAVPDLRDHYDRIPKDIESKLLAFQRDGVRFVLQHGGRALVADEMGLGKTLQAIAVATCVREAWPVLVLTPSSLRLHWASMIQEWLKIPPSDIVVVIADESHYLKNAQAKRTAATLPVLAKAQYVMLLSGTPALSRPIELFKQLEALYPDVYKNVHEYGSRYCRGGVFGQYQGASNHEELHNLIKATLMIRRLKKDVLSELPVKRRQQVFLDLTEKDLRQIKTLFLELGVLKDRIKASKSKDEHESLKFSEKSLINKIYNDSAEAKIPAVLEYLSTVIEKKKVGCIRIDGNTPAASRQGFVTDFQEKDTIRAAVLSIRAGGVGLTLTAASTVIFAELSWTPGDLIQAEDRAHRIGQVSSVNVYYLIANDTVDDIIWDVVHRKLENLGQVLDGEENKMEVTDDHPKYSPMKRKATEPSGSQSNCSPGKQTTIDFYMKRCSSTDHASVEPRLK